MFSSYSDTLGSGRRYEICVPDFFVVRYGWHYNWWLCALATGFFFLIDATFFSANLLKIAQGGWFPLAIGLLILPS